MNPRWTSPQNAGVKHKSNPFNSSNQPQPNRNMEIYGRESYLPETNCSSSENKKQEKHWHNGISWHRWNQQK